METPHLALRRALRLRWLMLLPPAALFFFSYFHRVAPAVVAADLMRAFAIPAASLGALAAVYPYVFMVMGLVAGGLVDALGPRRMLALGGTAMGLGAILLGLAPGFGVACAGRLVVALGASVILVSFLALVGAWFRAREFATIAGLSQTIGNVGALGASVPLALLVEAVGWRAAFAVIGLVTALLGLVALVAVRDHPALLGLPPVELAMRAPGPFRVRGVLAGVPEMLANPRSWPPVLAAAGVYASLITFQGLWAVPYLTQVRGLGRVEAASLVSLIAGGVVVGSPLVGWLSDRVLVSRRVPMAGFTLVHVACWLPLVVPALAVPDWALGPHLALLGLSACGLVLVWACVREVNDPARVGLAVGFANVPVFLLVAVVQWLTGAILDAHWTGGLAGEARLYPPGAFRAAFALCLGLAAGALVMALLVTETRCRNLWQPRR